MSIEYGTKDGAVLWIRNPFTGHVTYFNNIHRKPHAYRHLTNPQQSAPAAPAPPPTYDLRADMQRIQASYELAQACRNRAAEKGWAGAFRNATPTR